MPNKTFHIVAMALLLPAILVSAQDLIFEDGFENRDPVITTSPVTTAVVGSPYSYDVDATDDPGDILLYQLNTSPDGMTIDPASGLIEWTPTTTGTSSVVVEVTDGQGGLAIQAFDLEVVESIDSDNDGLPDDVEAGLGTDPFDPDSDDDFYLDGSEVTIGTDPLDPDDFPDLPPDPVLTAPELDPGTPFDMGDAVRFLYTPPNEIQEGITPDAIVETRLAVLRGRVLDSSGATLHGVRIEILNHPEFGFTRSRADGWFDMVVNGGGALSLTYSKEGRLPAQRTVRAPLRDFALAPDVVLVSLSSRVDTVDLTVSGTLQTGRGEMIGDDDGQRQATVMFPIGTSAEMVMPDGSTTPLTTLNVRATEYTVGEMGPAAMPAQLPTFTEYTYAVELSVDEALAAGAAAVTFNQPLPFYLENYLGLPVGGVVPAGYYDRERATWIPSVDGIVVKVVDMAGGTAEIDLDGDDIPESQAELIDFGFSVEELQQVAALYASGETLWRVPVTHFSPYDLNLPEPPSPESPAPDSVIDNPAGGNEGGDRSAGSGDVGEEDACEKLNSSFIGCQLSTVSERLGIPGTPYTLNYRSDRTEGRVENRQLDLTLVRQLPRDENRTLTSVELEISVAGQRIRESFSSPQAGLSYQFTWDGRDAYGRAVRGFVPATVVVRYAYVTVYCVPSFINPNRSFGRLCSENSSRVVRLNSVTGFTRTERTRLSAAAVDDIGGWTVDVHHYYDSTERSLYRGDGSRVRPPVAIESIIESVIGGGGSSDDGIPAEDASLGFQPWGIDVGSDGSVYIAISSEHRIRKIAPDGIITTIAGQLGNAGFSGDGGPAADALLNSPRALAVGPDDSIYFVDSNNQRVRRISNEGVMHTIAGGGSETSDIDGRLATGIKLLNPGDVEVADDGTFYLTATNISRRQLLKVGTDGRVSALPGFAGNLELTADGVPIIASSGCIYRAVGADRLDEACFVSDPDPRMDNFALAEDGAMYFNDNFGACIRRFDALDSIVSAVESENSLGDITVQFRPIDNVGDVLVGRDLTDSIECGPDTDDPTRGDGGPAASGWVGGFIPGFSVAPNSDLYLVDVDYFRVRRIRKPLEGFNATDFLIPADDEAAVYRFDSRGRHLQTISTLTGAVLYEFDYDAEGRLLQIRDGSGNETLIERAIDGAPSAIVAPFGQTTNVAINSDGYLSEFSNPASETYTFDYTPTGLVTAILDPSDNLSNYQYSPTGEMITAEAGDGYQQTLSRQDVRRGFEVTRTTGLGRTSLYRTGFNDDNDMELVNTDESGAETVIVHGRDYTTTTTLPTGTVHISSLLPDDEFGLQRAGAEKFELRTPSGKTLQVTTERSVALSDPADPLSIQSITQTRQIGNRTVSSVYDAATKTITTTSPTGRIQTATLDALGRQVSSNPAPGLAPQTQVFDAQGRLLRRQKGSEFVEYEYDDLGRVNLIRTAAGLEQSLSYDLADRPVMLTTPGNRSYQFGYDPLGRPTLITMPSGATHTLSYTLDSRIASYTPPGPGAAPLTQQFDADRRRNAVVLPDGRMRTIGFDANHRLNSITYPEATVLLSHAADTPLINSMSRTPAGGGASHTIANDYDGDLLTSKTIGTDVFSYRQDNDFRLAGVKLNEEPEWVFVHDDDDLVIGYGPFDITRDGPGGAPGVYSDGIMSLAYTFDDLGRLTDRVMKINGTTVYAFSLGFESGTGRISRREESIGASVVTLDYGYTPDGELATAEEGASVVENYAYDVNGNRTTANGITFTYDSQDRLLTAGATPYVFDENGLLATRGNDEFVYSSRGELLSVAIDGGETVSYGYDALGRRVSRTDSGGTTHYLFGDPNNPLQLLASRASDGTLTRYYYDESDILIGFERDGNRFYVASDQIGTPRLIVDAAGVITRQVDYDSFGKILADSNAAFDLPIGYAGGLGDRATGLVRFGFRDYEPASGRWTARDPLLFNGGQFNLYAYASSNPVSLRDPSGLFCVGYSYYTGYGAGGKFCFNLDGTVQACGEVGLGVGGGVSIDLNASAKEGVSNYVKGEASVGCGPVSAGVNASLDNCGNAKVCAGADANLSMPAAFQEANDVGFKAGGRLCYDFLSKELSGTGPFGASVSEKSGSSPFRESRGPQKTVKFGGRIKCKGTAGVKGGGCIGTKLF